MSQQRISSSMFDKQLLHNRKKDKIEHMYIQIYSM